MLEQVLTEKKAFAKPRDVALETFPDKAQLVKVDVPPRVSGEHSELGFAGRDWQIALWLFASLPERAMSPNETRRMAAVFCPCILARFTKAHTHSFTDLPVNWCRLATCKEIADLLSKVSIWQFTPVLPLGNGSWLPPVTNFKLQYRYVIEEMSLLAIALV